tara:strand:- start:144 stop:248 length:105 start_codon:yes stop_codon:yes gene_type:complete
MEEQEQQQVLMEHQQHEPEVAELQLQVNLLQAQE